MIKHLGILCTCVACGFVGSRADADYLIEGFESGNINNYTAYSGGVTQNFVSVSSAFARTGSYGLGLDGSSFYERTDAGATLAQGESFSANVRLGDLTGRAYFGFGASANSLYSVTLGPNTGQFIIQEDNPTTGSFIDLASSTYASYVAGDYYKVVVSWAIGGLITAQLFDGTTNALLTSVAVVNNDIKSGGIAFRGFSSTGGAAPDAFDNITMLTSVPEPASLLMTACGITLPLCYLRRRSRITA